MKVLVVSHNVFCSTSSMGKTLKSYFNGWNVENVAQLYIHSEVPTDSICKNYFRICDKEMIKSIFLRKSGRIFGEKDIDLNRIDSRTDVGTTAKLYQKARKRTPFIYILRNLWWTLGVWKTKQLLNWIDDFKPDAIFLASGDYAFIYKIALNIAKMRNIPLYVSCMDDYYFYNRNELSFWGRLYQKYFMNSVCKTMAYAKALFCICDKMSKDYSKLFNKPCYTTHTATSLKESLCDGEKKQAISYIGNLGLDRHRQLIAIGRTLKNNSFSINHIDVYSQEAREEILRDMTMENGIEFHGPISASKVTEVIKESLAVIHTESFDECNRRRVMYSVSTKIADSLASGTCIFAYGPKDVASIEYLKENSAAVCCFSENELSTSLRNLLIDEALRKKSVDNALILAKRNHVAGKTPELIKNVLEYFNN